MKRIIVGMLALFLTVTVFGREINYKINNTSMYDKLGVTCVSNGNVVSSKVIKPNTSDKITIPIDKANEHIDINFDRNGELFTISLASVNDLFNNVGLEYLDDYSDDGYRISGDLSNTSVYYNDMEINA